MSFEQLLAQRTAAMNASAVREILKVVAQPGMVSLAGGIPAPESFPLDIMRKLTAQVLAEYGAQALQYDASEGFAPLRAALVDHVAQKGVRATADEILVASGSQGVLHALGQILIGQGDAVAVEAPTYLGALQAFNAYQPRYVQLPTDENGLIPDALNDALRHHAVKFIYLAPTFQNPTGRTLPLERRKQVAAIIQRHHVLLVEDDPYSDLRYRGATIPPIKQLAPDHVVYVSTLSKILAPGLRIGFCIAPPSIRRWLVIVKQGVDLHTSTYNQALAAAYLDGGYLAHHLPHILALYKPRQEAMLAALDRYLPDGFRWSQPEGGMFIWIEGPDHLDAEQVYWRAVERNVAFVPGKFFFTHPQDGLSTMRLNYTMADATTIDHAIRVLAGVIENGHEL